MCVCLLVWCWWPASALSRPRYLCFPRERAANAGQPHHATERSGESQLCSCVSTHTLFLSCLPGHLLCQINLDISRVNNSKAISTAWSSERKRALWEKFALVCGLRGFLLLICSFVIYGVMNGEGLEGLIAQESATFQSEIGWDLFSLRADLWRAVFHVP